MKQTTSPKPWTLTADGKGMSAIVDADGKVVCGSLICQVSERTCLNHKYIMRAIKSYEWNPHRTKVD